MTARPDRIYPDDPRAGLVVGTFAASAFVHLHLEARARLYPHVPMLVHDDCSPAGEKLERLCDAYGADFEANRPRMSHSKGDLTAFAGGLRWAARLGLDVLAKMSRRFVPVSDWVASLVGLARASQYDTFSAHTVSYGFGFRTECVGMSVARWAGGGGLDEIIERVLAPGEPFVEGFVHDIARRLAARRCAAARAYDRVTGPRPPDRDGYAPWAFMGTDRCARSGRFLWHDAATPQDYADLARRWGLPYTAGDYADPDAG
jgi:hypothetical protein